MRARLKTLKYTTVYNHPQQRRTESQSPQQDSRRKKAPEQSNHHQRATISTEKERRREEGRGVTPRPMFGANSHRRRDRRQAEREQGHALTIRQTPTATPPRAAKPCYENGRNAPKARNARKLARKSGFRLHYIQ
nr:MAG TPA: hypothetical protein [Caudoviricetes sp.]